MNLCDTQTLSQHAKGTGRCNLTRVGSVDAETSLRGMAQCGGLGKSDGEGVHQKRQCGQRLERDPPLPWGWASPSGRSTWLLLNVCLKGAGEAKRGRVDEYSLHGFLFQCQIMRR